MKKSPVTVELFVRTGFRPVTASLAEALAGDFHCPVTTYRLTDPFPPIAARLAASTAQYLILVDACTAAPAEAVLPLLAVLDQSPDWAGATPAAQALTAFYGEASVSGSSEAAVFPIAALPPWLSVLRRSALAPPTLPWESLEFFLLDQAQHQGRFVQVGPADRLILDGRRWAATMLDGCAAHWAADFIAFRQRYPTATALVPPQFAVTVIGRFTDPPRLPRRCCRPEAFPKISVICPVFKPDNLAAMIASVRRQTWKNWELNLLVDGPPQPQLRKIVALLGQFAADPRIRLAFQANRGTGPTRNALAAASTGDFILSIDDDDALTDDALETFAAAIYANPGVPFFRAGARLTGLYSRQLRPRARLVIAGVINDVFEVTQPFAIAREALAAIGGYEWDEGLRRAGEDTLLFQKLDRLGMETCIIDKVLYYRRLGTQNLTLEFNRAECISHGNTLARRLHPPGWRIGDSREELRDDFQHASTVYHGPDGRSVVTSTRFFQYRTFGPVAAAMIDLELTSVCNANCIFCPREVMPRPGNFIAVETVRHLADQIAAMPQKPEVVFCGIGESTLHPELETITRLVAQSGARVSMTSNGARMTPQLFRHLARAGLQGFNFSLNAASESTYRAVMHLAGLGARSRMLEEIIRIRQAAFPKVALHVSFVVCDRNRHEVHHFVEQWRGSGVDHVWLHPVNNRAGLGCASADASDMARLARDYQGDTCVVVDVLRHFPEADGLCKVARSFNFIAADGSLNLCSMDYRRKTRYGNMASGSLQEAYYHKLQSFLAGETRELCRTCDFYPGAGSPGRTGSVQAAAPEPALAGSGR